jgi:hypothetical protein
MRHPVPPRCGLEAKSEAAVVGGEARSAKGGARAWP